ncbi:MAG: aldehyde dehydrogenase family protein [Phycisphaerales bacterium]
MTSQPWPELSIRQRCAWCARFRRALSAHADTLIQTMSDEIHKTPFEALAADLMPLLAAARWHERNARRLLGPERLSGKPIWMPGIRATLHRMPVGRVAIIATWNYPAQLLGIQLIQALVAGNTVVVKPSEHAPRTQRLLLELARQALPDEFTDADRRATLDWTEPTRDAGPRLLNAERWDHVVFTGSTGVGRSIAEWAAGTLTPTTLELSGCDSAFVLESADAPLAARSIWNALTMNAGQTCMAPRRVLAHRGIAERFAAELRNLAEHADPRRLINADALERARACLDEAIRRGARLFPEHPIAEDGTIRPTLALGCPPDTALARGEHFAPLLAIIATDTIDEAMRIHHAVPQHLATSIFAARAEAQQLATRLRTSSVITINDALVPTGHPDLPIAGVHDSGWHASRGTEGLLALTRPVTITSTGKLMRPPVATTAAQQSKLHKSMARFIGFWYPPAASNPRPSAATKSPTHDPSPTRAPSSARAGAGSGSP